MLPDGFEYVEVRGNFGMLCVHKRGPSLFTLCDRRVYAVLEKPHPEDLSNIHRECLQKMLDLPRPQPRPVRIGRCPMCNGDTELVGGRTGPHKRWVPGINGVPVQSSEPCVGVNVKPRLGRRR